MKTITRNDTNVSLYLFDDTETVVMAATETTVGNPPQLIISDCGTSNSTLYEGVTNPDEWVGWKYLYTTEDGWVLNPDWIPPSE